MTDKAGTWYEYSWDLSGQTAWFHVDLSYLEEFDHLGDFTTLLYVTCFPPETRLALTQSDYRQLDLFLKSCLSVLGDKAVYVGFIDLPAQRRYYFYCADARVFVPLLNLCNSTPGFRITCEKVVELNRQTYYRLLAPDTAQLQSADNLAYIRALSDRGDELDMPRRVNLHFFFPTGNGRDAFKTVAKDLGFAIGADDYIPERELPYYLVLHRISPLVPAAITDLTTKAIYAAEEFGGILEHFDSAFVPRRDYL